MSLPDIHEDNDGDPTYHKAVSAEQDSPLPSLGSIDDSIAQIDALHKRAHALLSEFRSFQAYLEKHRRHKEVEFRTFRTNVLTEVKRLDDVLGTRGIEHEDVGHGNTEDGSAEGDGGELDCDVGVDEEAMDEALERPRHVNGGYEQESASGVSAGESEAERKRAALLRSSNLSFWETVWATAKTCRGITALGKRVYVPKQVATSEERRRRAVTVDIVAQDGAEWIKVSTTSQKRLLFDMAKEGWTEWSSDQESSDEEAEFTEGHQQDVKVELVQLAEDLLAASKSQRVRHKHPKVSFVLSRLEEGSVAEVDAVIQSIREQGTTVHCAQQPVSPLPLPPNDDLWSCMAPSSNIPTLTSTLNIDCTVLLALISDISHYSTSKLSSLDLRFKSYHYHSAILSQIRAEQVSPMLPTEVYPLLGTRKLVCSTQAEERMREIVETMGTGSERERADLLFARGTYHACARDELLMHFRRLSSHEVSADLDLPIEMYTFGGAGEECSASWKTGSRVVHDLVPRLRLSPINASVFLGGWFRNEVIVTSNRVVAAALEKAIDGLLDDVEGARGDIPHFEGPRIYVCKSARSLVGKSKPNAKASAENS